jgi:hypothetical protein
VPARPSDKDRIRVKTLGDKQCELDNRDGGILICLSINVEIIIWKVK